MGEPLENYAEGEPGFGEVADDVGEAVEFFVEGLKEFGEGHSGELGVEPGHGFLTGALAFGDAVVADVMAAESFVAEGGGLAKFSGGQEVGA